MKAKFNQDRFFSIFAVVISLLTLISLVYQNRLISKNQKAAVMPYLEIGEEGIGSENYRVAIENKGTGPALISKVSYSIDGQSYLGGIADFIHNEDLELPPILLTYGDVYADGLISSGERLELLVPIDSISTVNLSQIITERKFDFTVIYTSIYGTEWESSLRHIVPEMK